jgi:hypothetical protein
VRSPGHTSAIPPPFSYPVLHTRALAHGGAGGTLSLLIAACTAAVVVAVDVVVEVASGSGFTVNRPLDTAVPGGAGGGAGSALMGGGPTATEFTCSV